MNCNFTWRIQSLLIDITLIRLRTPIVLPGLLLGNLYVEVLGTGFVRLVFMYLFYVIYILEIRWTQYHEV
jgi:hypothetical protein